MIIITKVLLPEQVNTFKNEKVVHQKLNFCPVYYVQHLNLTRNWKLQDSLAR